MREVLFVCLENACRSQIAEGFFNKYPVEATAYSAGSTPAKSIDPKTVVVMKEQGIELADKKPTTFNPLLAEKFDFIITMGCKEVCPITPKKKTIKWAIEDPAGGSIRKYRDIRDIIEDKVKSLIEEIEA